MKYFKKGAGMKQTKSIRKKQDMQLWIMSILPLIKLFLFSYLPMAGIIIAFEHYKVSTMFLSKWAGLHYFQFIFTSPVFFKLIRNALILNSLYIVLGTAFSIIISLFLYTITKKIALRSMQTIFFFPYFISWPLVGLLLVALLGTNGMITGLFNTIGIAPDFYSNSPIWIAIITFTNIWKYAGLMSITYYAVLLGTDKEIYEASSIDGANVWQKMFYISLPQLKYMILIGLIMSSGNIIRTDFSMVFYTVGSNTQLYEYADVLETFMFRALSNSTVFSQNIALGVFQGVIGLILCLAANYTVNKIDKESSLF